MPTIDTLVTEALQDLATGDPQITTTQLTAWWNRRQRTLASQVRWWFMRGNQVISVSVVGGSGPYTLAGTTQLIEEVLYAGTPLDSIPLSQGAIIFPTAGSPQAFSTAPGSGAGALPVQFYIFPSPNQTYNITIYAFSPLTDLAYGSGQINVFTDQFPELVKAAMCWSAFERLEEDNMINYWKGKYNEELLPILQAQSEFDLKGVKSEPHPSFAASSSLLGGGGGTPKGG